MAELLKGAPVASFLTEELISRSKNLKQSGIVPMLAILRVGERPDDIFYENAAVKRCGKIGIDVKRRLLPADCGREAVLSVIREINADPAIHGCLMFRPLADKRTEEAACELLLPEKDVDGMTPGSLATVYAGNGRGFAPCTARACMELLHFYGIPVAGKRVAVVGRSLVIGRPVAMLLQQENATVTMCHTGTKDPAAICREADIVVAAAGRAGLVDRSYVSSGQVLVDVGINVDESGNLCGDAAFQEVEPLVTAVTPVPGGVGSVTTAVLAKHVIEAAEKTVRR